MSRLGMLIRVGLRRKLLIRVTDTYLVLYEVSLLIFLVSLLGDIFFKR